MHAWSLFFLFSVLPGAVHGAIPNFNMASQSQFLYEGEDATAVTEYKAGVDFMDSKAPRIVEFYSPMCGHCINYAPKYMQLAKEVIAKYPQAEFWAVSCKAHREVCANHTIRGYPTIHLFKAGEDKSTVIGSVANEEQIVKALQLDKPLQEEERKLALDEDDDSQADKEKVEDKEKEEAEVEDESAEAEIEDKEIAENSEGEADKNSPDNDESEAGAVQHAPDVDDSEEDTPDPPAVDESEEKGTDEDSPGVKTSEEDSPDAPDVDESEERANVAPGAPDFEETAKSEDDDSNEEPELVESDKQKDSNEEDVDSDEGDIEGVEDSDKDDDAENSDAYEDEAEGRRNRGKQHDSHVSEVTEESRDGAPHDTVTITDSVNSFGDKSEAVTGVKPGAGAVKGMREPRDMDKWQQLIADSKKKLEKRKALLRQARANVAEPGATKIMKANTPGTTEYRERVNSLLKKINSLRKMRGVPPLRSAAEIAKKAKQALKKDIKEPRFAEKVPVIKRLVKLTPEEENILDSSLSFIGGLKYGLFMTNDALTAKQKSALQAWLDLLSVSLPPEWGLHALIDELNGNIDSVAQGNENLLKILRKHPIPRDTFSASCRKPGSPQGFSCGLWKLFHTATVGIAEHRGGLNLRESGVAAADTRIFSPAEAAHAIREYVAHFFGCTECRNHFIAQYDQCSFRRCDRLTSDAVSATPDDWKQLPLWLWEVHNDVSVRVANEKIARHSEGYSQARVVHLTRVDEIRYLFPSLETCLQCFGESGSFDEDAVFEFLEATYWSGPDVMADKLLKYKDTDAYSSGSFFFWFFIIVVIAGFFIARALKEGGSGGLKQSMNAALVTGRKIGGKKRSV